MKTPPSHTKNPAREVTPKAITKYECHKTVFVTASGCAIVLPFCSKTRCERSGIVIFIGSGVPVYLTSGSTPGIRDVIQYLPGGSCIVEIVLLLTSKSVGTCGVRVVKSLQASVVIAEGPVVAGTDKNQCGMIADREHYCYSYIILQLFGRHAVVGDPGKHSVFKNEGYYTAALHYRAGAQSYDIGSYRTHATSSSPYRMNAYYGDIRFRWS